MPQPVLMIAHTYYDEDPRVRREAEALVASGRPVHVIALRQPGAASTGEVAGVRVTRLDVRRHQGAGPPTYLREYLSFGVRAAGAALAEHRRQRLALVQVHSLPDFLVGAALPLRLRRVPVVLDLHEAMPEFFGMRFPHAANPVSRRALLAQERASIGLADLTFVTNDAMRDRLLRRGIAAARVQVVPNAPSLARFATVTSGAARPFMADGKLRLVYAGALTPTYELEVAIGAVARLAHRRPALDPTLELYGRGDSERSLRHLAETAGVGSRVRFHGRIPLEAVPTALAGADIGIAPTRLDPFTAMTLSTKVHEYAMAGRPVVASRLPLVERTFPGGAVATYDPGDVASMAAAITRLVDDPAEREAAIERARAIVVAGSWEREAVAYVATIERLIDGATSRRPTSTGQVAPSRR